ncbi:MAG: NAD-dependent epimerase/dehydratase family protein [Eubacterium sp.]
MTNIVKQDIKRIACADLNWKKLEGKTVLITGATGFIGSFIISALMQRVIDTGTDIKVIAMVRSKERAIAKFTDYMHLNKISFIVGDVTNPIETDLKADYIIHCASNAAPDMYASDPVGTMQINFFGTSNLLDYAKACGAEKFLYVSTIEVYGKTENLDTIGEEDFGYISSSNVRSCYPESKKCCENLTVCYGKQYGVNVSIGRLSYIYGAGMSKTDSKVCALFARKVAAGDDIVLKSTGEQLRSYTYVSDAISGLLTVLLDGKNGEAYNIASSTSRITIVDMAKRYCSLFPEKGSKVKFDLPSDYEKGAFSFIANAVLDSSKLENLGWQGQVSLDDGLTYAVLDNLE